jgi:hypothetical protein
MEGGVNTSEADGVLADEVGEADVSEPHAARVMTSDAAQATIAKEEDTREVFTVVTLPPHPAFLASGPAKSTMGRPALHRAPKGDAKTTGRQCITVTLPVEPHIRSRRIPTPHELSFEHREEAPTIPPWWQH